MLEWDDVGFRERVCGLDIVDHGTEQGEKQVFSFCNPMIKNRFSEHCDMDKVLWRCVGSSGNACVWVTTESHEWVRTACFLLRDGRV